MRVSVCVVSRYLSLSLELYIIAAVADAYTNFFFFSSFVYWAASVYEWKEAVVVIVVSFAVAATG